MLKSPFHLLHLSAIRRVLPNARYINLVRRSEHAVSSFLYLLGRNHWALYGKPLPPSSRAQWIRVLSQIAGESIAIASDRRCTTVHYEALARDPVATTGQLLGTFGRAMSGRHRSACAHWLNHAEVKRRGSGPTTKDEVSHLEVTDEMREYNRYFGL